MTPLQEKSIAVLGQGIEKYGSAGLLLSSADRGWSGLHAELRSHSDGAIAWNSTHPDTEICVDVCGNGSIISREGRDAGGRTAAKRGTIWLSPAGSQEGSIDISDPVPGILHIYLPSHHFSPNNLDIGLDESVVPLLRQQDSFQDPLLAEMAYALISELETQTSAGRLLADTLASSLAARLVQRHLSPSPVRRLPRLGQKGLDRGRLWRVLDYIEANLEGDLTIEHLASVACLSRFHFARAFKAALGRSPHQYVSAKRLEHAKALLARADRPLVDIALALKFSCQANFTRAFAQATGQTPGRYRRTFKST
ncbi:MAG TPA: helix-turn-helix domain-containing protein [Reyranella sp.]